MYKAPLLALIIAVPLCGCNSSPDFEGPAAYENAPAKEKIERIKKAALSPKQKEMAIDNLDVSAEEKTKLKKEIAGH